MHAAPTAQPKNVACSRRLRVEWMVWRKERKTLGVSIYYNTEYRIYILNGRQRRRRACVLACVGYARFVRLLSGV